MTDRFEVRLSKAALADLSALGDYIAVEASPEQAARLLDRVTAVIDALEDFPFRGPVPKELDAIGVKEFRQAMMPPYRIFYQVVDRTVTILLIADGRRDIPALLARRLLSRPS